MKASSYWAAGGVVIEGDQVLVLNRPARSELRLPKGHIRPGEAADVTALRETTEETGYCDLRLLADLGSMVVSFEYERRRVIRFERFFLLRLASRATVSRPAKDEQQFEAIWLPSAEALEGLTFEPERAWLRRALACRGATSDPGSR